MGQQGMDSILQARKECWFCGTTYNLHSHHIYFGANRKNSEKYGFKVWVCAEHHNMGGNGHCVHQCREMDLELKRACQKKFEETHARVEFMRIIGKNYSNE